MKQIFILSLATFTLFVIGFRTIDQPQKVRSPTGANSVGIASLEALEEDRTPFPLYKGSYWIYQGITKWVDMDSGEISETNLTWKMEIVDTIERGHLKVAIVKGHPADLAWYREGKERGDYLIVEIKPGKFYLISGDRTQEVLNRVKNEADFLVNLVQEIELFLDWPALPGKVFGPEEQLTRLDGGYRWNVEESETVELKAPGIFGSETHRQYRLSFRTAPDIISVAFVPGVGISGYQYRHRGSVASTDLKLIEYHLGTEESQPTVSSGSLQTRSRSANAIDQSPGIAPEILGAIPAEWVNRY